MGHCNIMIYNKFNTLEAAQEAQNNDFLALKAKKYSESESHAELDKYYKLTTAWANVMETIDGNFAYLVCPDIITEYETVKNPVFKIISEA